MKNTDENLVYYEEMYLHCPPLLHFPRYVGLPKVYLTVDMFNIGKIVCVATKKYDP